MIICQRGRQSEAVIWVQQGLGHLPTIEKQGNHEDDSGSETLKKKSPQFTHEVTDCTHTHVASFKSYKKRSEAGILATDGGKKKANRPLVAD